MTDANATAMARLCTALASMCPYSEYRELIKIRITNAVVYMPSTDSWRCEGNR